MADTGAPYFIPYVEPTDLVRDYPAADEASADAIAAALDATGGLVAVRHILKDNPFTASVTSGNSVEVTGLSISHAVADATHDVYVVAMASGSSGLRSEGFGISVTADGTAIAPPASPGSRVATTVAGFAGDDTRGVAAGTVVVKHTPGSTASVDYAVRAHNVFSNATETVTINRGRIDSDSALSSRTVSTLVLFEVKV